MSGLRRSFLGYRPSDVRVALAARDEALVDAENDLADRDERLGELQGVAERLSEAVVERDRQIRDLREELADARAREEAGMDALATVARQVEELRCQARGQATRIRLRALRDAAQVSELFSELARAPGDAGVRIVDSLEEAIRRLSDGSGDEPPEDPKSNGHPGRSALELFEGMVHVDVGPLSDFSQLVGFEDAANSIGATSEISVKRFSAGRATLAMRLREPVELLRELEERSPLDFRVRSLKDDRLILDVGEE